MQMLLVRHGHAGAKRQWQGDDGFRLLDAQGLAQAAALVDLLAPFTPTRILSSPFLRCVQTVTPLGDAHGIPIERSPSLVPEAGAAATLLARGVSIDGPGAIVLCTHGEVIHDMQAQLAHDGLPDFGPASLREKGSVWLLDRTDGRFTGACYLPPPRLG
ncbi:MAG: histidine phosphatase family protein [Acidimicrobiales bacterium]|jgi:8-oxo-dGTP diphosphatase